MKFLNLCLLICAALATTNCQHRHTAQVQRPADDSVYDIQYSTEEAAIYEHAAAIGEEK